MSKVFTTITDLYKSKLGWLLPAGPLIKAIFFLKDNWDEIWGGIKSTFKTVTDALVTIFQNVKEKILGIWDGMVSGIKGAVNMVIGVINLFIRAINSIKISVPSFKAPKWLGGMGWGGFDIGFPNIGEIPTLAKGGIVTRPTMALLGEAGPEAVVPLGGGRGMAPVYNITITDNTVFGEMDFRRLVVDAVTDSHIRGGMPFLCRA